MTALVAKVKKDLPWLHELVDLGQVLKVRASSDERVRRVILGWIVGDQVTITEEHSHADIGVCLLLGVHPPDGLLGLDEVGWIWMTRFEVVELWVGAKDVVESVQDIVLLNLLLFRTVGILNDFLLEDGVAYNNFRLISNAPYLH